MLGNYSDLNKNRAASRRSLTRGSRLAVTGTPPTPPGNSSLRSFNLPGQPLSWLVFWIWFHWHAFCCIQPAGAGHGAGSPAHPFAERFRREPLDLL